MNIIIIGIYIFLRLLEIILFIDVILSWLPLLGISLRPKFISDLLDPLYNTIKKFLPVNIGPISFDALILLLIIGALEGIMIYIFPGLVNIFN